MKYFYLSIIPALWLAWLGYWIVAATGAKETARRESIASRASHLVPLILGGVFLGVPHILGGTLEGRFHVRSLAWFWFSVALIVLGLGFSVLARVWLGGNWSGTVTLKQDHQLIRSGPYAYARHPIYTGLLLALFGSALAIGRWRTLVALALLIAALIRKITIEERFMDQEFGADYARYRAEVAALVPYLL
jgi:protein-S-isoprenylcysteine O-methyltransferase Ste14